MKTKLLVMLLAVLFALSASAGAAPEPVLPTLEKGPYLIYTGVIDENTEETEMMVLWQLEDTQTCKLEWGLWSEESCSYGDPVTVEPTPDFPDDLLYRYVITGLTTGTKYCYQVTVGEDTYPGSFTTAPADDATSIKILAFGDTRSQPKKMDDVTGQMITTYTDDPEFQTIALHSGDWVNSNAELDWAEEFFNPDCANNREFQANVPIAGCRGNHEGNDADLYAKYYPYPYPFPYVKGDLTTGFYWSFDYGPIHVVMIDNANSKDYVPYDSSSDQYKWLEADLADSDKPWKIAVYHSPAWGTGWHSNDTDSQNYLHPLFVQYNVPIIINGDNHNYVRCDVDGIRHITSGGGGAPLYSVKESDPYVVECTRTYHHCEITIDGDELIFEAYDSAGKSIGGFIIVGDSIAPTPDPMTFYAPPVATGPTSIAMTADVATDVLNGVIYYFTCETDPCHDSGWQNETFYEDTGLTPDTTYTYTVKARDTSANRNETVASSEASATTDSSDTVTVTKAKYSVSKEELKVEATSTAGGSVTLTVVGYGAMTYKASTYTYSYSAKPVDPPGESVTVTSSGGGSGTIAVK